MKMRLWMIVNVFLFILLPMKGQEKVSALKGKVLDGESGDILPSVTVRLLSADSTFLYGKITDEKGVFMFENVNKGKYILSLSCIGYANISLHVEMTGKERSLADIYMRPDNIMLGDVEVKGSSTIHKKDHLLIIPDKKLIKHSYSGYDLLYNLMLPGVTVDRREGKVMTPRGIATLYINGERAEFREVQNLRSKDIEKVEYYDMPTQEYFGDIASINYITKKYQTGGYVAVDGDQNIGYLKGNYNLASKLVHKATSYTLFGGYSVKKHDGIKTSSYEQLNFPDYTVCREKGNENALYKNEQQYMQFKVSNVVGKRNLSGLVSLVRDVTPNDDRNDFLNYTKYLQQKNASSSQVSQNNLKPSLSLKGDFAPTERQRVRIFLDGSYAKNQYDRTYTEQSRSFTTNADEDLYSFSVVGIYNLQLKGNNSLGGNVQHYHHITSSHYQGDYDLMQNLWVGETLTTCYYTHNLGNNFSITLSPGFSLLRYRLKGNALQNYWNFRTHSWIRYSINSKHQLLGGLSMGNYQPSLECLNEVDQAIDLFIVKRGNPNLGNTKIHDYFFTYNGQVSPVNLQFSMTYTTLTDNTTVDYFIEKDKLVNSYQANTFFRKLNTELLCSYRVNENISTNLAVKYEYMNAPGKSALKEHNIFASIDMNYFLGRFTFNAFGKTTERKLDQMTLAFLRIPASYGFSVRYNGKTWMAEVGTENPFTQCNRYREYANYGIYKYNQIQTSRIYQQTGYVKLAYTFDFGRKTSHEQNYVNKTINSAIMKAN